MTKSKLNGKTANQIAHELNITDKLIDRHYEIENEALKTDDIYDASAVEFIACELAEYDHDALEYNWYEAKANQIIDQIGDDVADKICERDRDAMEYENERREAMK